MHARRDAGCESAKRRRGITSTRSKEKVVQKVEGGCATGSPSLVTPVCWRFEMVSERSLFIGGGGRGDRGARCGPNYFSCYDK